MFFNKESKHGASSDGAEPVEALPYAADLAPELQAAVKPLAAVFGADTMSCFYSGQWAPREAALRRVEKQLRNHDTSSGTCDRRIFLCAPYPQMAPSPRRWPHAPRLALVGSSYAWSRYPHSPHARVRRGAASLSPLRAGTPSSC